jgi:hypothetical protein
MIYIKYILLMIIYSPFTSSKISKLHLHMAHGLDLLYPLWCCIQTHRDGLSAWDEIPMENLCILLLWMFCSERDLDKTHGNAAHTTHGKTKKAPFKSCINVIKCESGSHFSSWLQPNELVLIFAAVAGRLVLKVLIETS